MRVLHLEDDPRDAELIREKLRQDGLACEIVWVDRKEAFVSALARGSFDLVLTDYKVPDYSGVAALREVLAIRPGLPVVVVSGTVGEEEAIACLKAGATDYILKQRPQRLAAALTRAVKEAEERRKRLEAEQSLRESEERFRAAFEQAAVGMALREIDPRKPRWLQVNRKLCEILGYAQEELLQLTSVDLTPPGERDLAIDYNERMLRGEIAGYTREKRYVRKDGRIIWVNLSISPVRGPEGRPRHVVSVIEDITDRKEAEDRIRRLNRVHAVLSGINALIVRVRDREELCREACRIAVEHGNFAMAWIGMLDPATLDVNAVAWAGIEAESFARMKATARGDRLEGEGVMGRAIRDGKPAFSNDIAAEGRQGGERRREALRRGYRSIIALPLIVDGNIIGNLSLYAWEANFFDDDELKLLKELASDISFALDHIAKEEKVRYLSYYDALTGLPNGTLFEDRLASTLRVASEMQTKVAVMVLDVNRLRHVNDTLGRQAGDAVLREVGDRLKQASPDPESVARISADEFASVLANVRDVSDVIRLLEDPFTEALRAPITIDGQQISVTVTAGIALFPDDGSEAGRVYSNAAAALRQAKKRGEQYLFYQPSMNASVAETLSLESRLRKALEAEHFVLHYQPKLQLATGRVTGVEALIRWNDPESGLVPPAKFIPLLEETGLILRVGRWAMQRALADYREWCARGLPAPRVAVNVSAIELKRHDFADTVRVLIEGSAAQAHGLDLEITETLLMDDIERSILTLKELRDMGLRIVIDDFGTGYSSLSYLAKLPISALKIDRSFIVRMAEDPDSMSIVSTIISLAHSLKREVIAEGVETEQQRALLGLLKCDEIQGYLVARPMPPTAIAEWLTAR